VRFQVLVLSVLVFGSYADSETQTDWSAGPGTSTPVTSWEDDFYCCDAADWSGTVGSLLLAETAIIDPVKHYIEQTYVGADCIYAADLDGDGDCDVVCGSELQNRIDWWENSDTQPGLFVSQNTVDSNVNTPLSLFCIDLENDGDVDILGTSSNVVAWWENDGSGSGWTQHTLVSGLHDADGIHAADVDGDGDLDISAAEIWDGGAFYWFENTDSIGTTWSCHTVLGSFYIAESTFLADIDGDGDEDMLAGGGDGVYWFENVDGLGTPPWTQHDVDPGVALAVGLSAFDFDGDGDIDLSRADYGNNDLMWWENIDGTGNTLQRHNITLSYGDPATACACDFDSDGDYDFLSESYQEDNVTIWENIDGVGDIWHKIIIESDFINPGESFVADLNNDGLPDALASAYTGNEILWWEVCGLPSKGYLESAVLYLGNDPGWGDITWNHTSPGGTSIDFLVRSSDDPDSMGIWSDTLLSPGSLYGVLGEGDSFMQYLAILQTDSPGTTPVLEDVTVSWNPTGIEGHSALTTSLIGARCNPSYDTTSIEFILNESMMVELIVFDLSGRMVREVSDEYPSGMNEVEVSDLRTGVYFVRMISGDFNGTERFVLIE